MADVLGRAVIEIGVDEMRLQDELAESQRHMSKALSASLQRVKMTANEQQKLFNLTRAQQRLDMDRVKLADAQVRSTVKLGQATKWHAEMVQKLTSNGAAIKQFFTDGPMGDTKMQRFEKLLERVSNATKTGFSIAGGVGAGAAGLTFAAAAAAGSTTLDTLTGSLKMLSLAAGAKLQNAVMGISKRLQSLAHSVDSTSKTNLLAGGGLLAGAAMGYKLGGFQGAALGAGVGLGGGLALGGHSVLGYGLAGASIGGMVGGMPGAMVGAAGGALFGTVATTKTRGEYIEDIAVSFLKDKERAGRALGVAARLEKQAQGLSGDQRGSTLNAAKWIREGLAKSEAMRAAGLDGQFKPAGLNLPASYVGLADVRQQAQMAAVSKSPIEMENFIKELKNNTDALREANQLNGGGNTGNVQSP